MQRRKAARNFNTGLATAPPVAVAVASCFSSALFATLLAACNMPPVFIIFAVGLHGGGWAYFAAKRAVEAVERLEMTNAVLVRQLEKLELLHLTNGNSGFNERLD